MALPSHLHAEHLGSGAPSGAQTPSLTHLKRNREYHYPFGPMWILEVVAIEAFSAFVMWRPLRPLQALKQGTDDGGIDTPGHGHHFANKGVDPAELSGTLKKHIAKGAHEGERKLNDFSADPTERLNPHFAKAFLKEVDLDEDAPVVPENTPAHAAEETKS
ncbi:6393_t:CDS:2 [Acaulospora colombiana]|uniref:6393_t:CDS:1 n=1 Tax=Acaulospora colombiana TaxID=27376 RepID=A0ACA9MRR1_9GLOM|nr:6393_t:CDS:2 [Acaulospora colombiana]